MSAADRLLKMAEELNTPLRFWRARFVDGWQWCADFEHRDPRTHRAYGATTQAASEALVAKLGLK